MIRLGTDNSMDKYDKKHSYVKLNKIRYKIPEDGWTAYFPNRLECKCRHGGHSNTFKKLVYIFTCQHRMCVKVWSSGVMCI